MNNRSQFRSDAVRDCCSHGFDPRNHIGIGCGVNWNWILSRTIYGPKFRFHLWQPPKEHIPYLDE